MIVVALLALGAAWLSRRGDQARSAGLSAAGVSSSQDVGGAAGGSSSAGSPTSSSIDPTSGVDVPVDPTGSRRRHDAPGARQAAIDYVSTVKQRVMYLGDDGTRAVLQAWAAPGVAASEVELAVGRVAQLRASLAASGGEVWWVVSPLAVKVAAYGPDRARVAVWSATVMASGAPTGVDATVTAPQVAYRTSTVDLVWGGPAGWSVWSVDDVPGPTPMAVAGVAPSGPEEFIAGLTGFGLIKEHY